MSDVKQMILNELAEIYTTLPGEVISWDGVTAVVRPALPKQLANGESLPPPQIFSVPVCFPIGDEGAAMISVPLKSGDPVKLSFSARALDEWLSGSSSAPSDPRQFDLSDCFATPVVRPMVGKADTSNVRVAYGSGEILIAPGGDCTFNGPSFTVNAPTTITGPLTYTAGMNGSGGDGVSATINGNINHTGGVISSDKPIEDGHKHRDSTGGMTGGPI